MRKSLKPTKKNWDKLYAKARAEFSTEEHMDAALNGVVSPWDIMTFAWDNADDTFKHNENHPDYWEVAFASIQCSCDAYGVGYEWFKKNRYII